MKVSKFYLEWKKHLNISNNRSFSQDAKEFSLPLVFPWLPC